MTKGAAQGGGRGEEGIVIKDLKIVTGDEEEERALAMEGQDREKKSGENGITGGGGANKNYNNNMEMNNHASGVSEMFNVGGEEAEEEEVYEEEEEATMYKEGNEI
eukprot:CAMPEP_0175053342 /NCGR_PEP_ID=MMETSP0052_2-20121109/8869_1 /TAXON_ID=51329 ORGANISM="Polytomella parva, Strain SAG 63-3" /NCGR_SAMPLE_ID=MMETSP0052_2 /ASSEMBLY_ACC=CAM_ASM_000194 /LENGTH=105 /DNA_ID=CAMNT_0016317861 /DNA_START=82 /DNA_END=399 /DNA_ORIENTATION=-